MPSPNRPVLILGVEPRITVPVARSLHHLGVPVAVASLSDHDLTLHSRAISKYYRLPKNEHSPSGLLPGLSSFIRENGFDTLIPVTDGALGVVSQHYDELSKLLRLACPPARIIDRVLNKEATLAIAVQCGIPVPREYDLSGVTDIAAIPGLIFPVVAKPRQKSAAEAFKVRYFHSEHELSNALNSGILENVILQEYSRGEGVGVEVLYHKGACVAAFQHRRLKEVPHTGGAAAMAIAEPLNPQLLDMALKLLAGLEWEGVAMVEFRYDRNTGAATLMEVNGRYWGTVALALGAGVDFPAYEWQIAHGTTPEVPTNYDVGLRWRWTAGSVRRVYGMIRSSKSSLPSQCPNPAAQQSATRARPVHDSLWSISDPLPAISELIKTGKDLAMQNAKGILKKVSRR